MEKENKKSIIILLAFFISGFCVYKFYLGQTKLGIIVLLICWYIVPIIFLFINFIKIFMSKYTNNK